jgi:hypothetical protein
MPTAPRRRRLHPPAVPEDPKTCPCAVHTLKREMIERRLAEESVALLQPCEKCGRAGGGLHGCPYAHEINDNQDAEYCNCCDACAHECAMGI